MDDRKDVEERFEALDKLVRRLEDGLVVETVMGSRHRDRHQEWLRDHQQWLDSHQNAMESHNRAMAELDKKLWIASRICSVSEGAMGAGEQWPGLKRLMTRIDALKFKQRCLTILDDLDPDV